jgi:RNA polymerase sigma-70 factor (ECF subfamily)
LAEIPHLRAFAVSLARNPDRADDLVQQTLLRAYSNIRLFDPGSNMSAWLVTILRNEFDSEQRTRRREIPDSDGAYAGTLVIQAGQVSQAECQEFYEALGNTRDG